MGANLEITTPHNPEQDPVSERAIRTIIERVRSIMIEMDIPDYLWPEILKAVVVITNRTATSSLKGKTPYEEFMDQVEPSVNHIPSVAHFRVLGCKAYVQIPVEDRVLSQKTKLRTEVGILVGYKGEYIYRVYVPLRKVDKIVRSSNVRFDEATPTSEMPRPISSSDVVIDPLIDRGENVEDVVNTEEAVEPQQQIDETPQQDVEPVIDSHRFRAKFPALDHELDNNLPDSDDEYNLFQYSPEDTVDEADTADDEAESEPEVVEPKKRGRPKGAKNKIHKPVSPSQKRSTRSQTNPQPDFEEAYAAGATISADPLTLEEALASPEASHWRLAIQMEYSVLSRKKTWTRMKRSEVDGKVLGGKLVFKTKRDKDSNILKYKAR